MAGRGRWGPKPESPESGRREAQRRLGHAIKRLMAPGARLLAAALVALACATPAWAHNLPYTLLNVVIGEEGRADIEIRSYVPALIMGMPQGHLPEGVLPTFLAFDDADLDRRAANAATALAAQTTLRIDGRVAPTPPITAPPAAVLKADARVPSSSPQPSAPLRLSFRPPDDGRTFDLALPPDLGPVVMVVRYPGGATKSYAVRDGERSPTLRFDGPSPVRDSLAALGTYLLEGIRHIVPGGLDHVLFIAVMAVGAPRFWSLLKLATVFTVAHSVTLALSTLGYLSAPSEVVEPAIALSITLAALMNLRAGGASSEGVRYAAVFGIGLLHGLGFAGALADLGLPREQVSEALIGFNLGVEAGQILVILAVLATFGWFRGREWYASRIVAPASIAVACVGLYLAVERLIPATGA